MVRYLMLVQELRPFVPDVEKQVAEPPPMEVAKEWALLVFEEARSSEAIRASVALLRFLARRA